mmetsp:Transcript_7557/g.9611  ORF Transcript_7557/g.9611 Transcript_7557/m.9611 type:complete len:296 (-) Transcript_7557:248-1135(-)|eukprot:CAMPEP_0204823892 /NCGR_PEP_ID=MMETSP1346-20131115/1963_1 /ASSEMBLY_ACC=CAM_ASM_000771 /TAXON_ID=215587 /ORGANISM="Aplanochytrium stocchinoi, Strain GSBS06" /LENGTH=295 /DNA_ID=CAMNT_0051950747 /DNA_START=274 /DNA_END=1161 /DNA_ORIENTATION=-
MAQRNLTRKFKTLRDGFNARRRPRGGIGGTDGINQDYLHSLPPHWVDSVEEIKVITAQIKDKIVKLNQSHKNRLLVRFDESEGAQDREIDILTVQITDKFREAEKRLKLRIGNMSDVVPGSSEYLVRENIKRQLAGELQQLSVSFRKSQKEYMSRLKSQKGETAMDDILGLDNDAEAGRGGVSLSSGFTDEQVMLLEMSESTAQERDQEIQHIAQSINELATIFKDLAALVIDQGTILDRIDYNMENVQIQTQRGLDELIKADNIAKNSRPFKCIIILVIVIVVEALILIIKHAI